MVRKVTPMTVADETEFAVVRRGYDRAQVDEQIDMLSTQLRTAVAARESASAEVEVLSRRLEASVGDVQAARSDSAQWRAEADKLRGQVSELSTIPHTVDGMSERLQQMVRIAQDEVNDMRQRATSSAAHVLALAQAEADELRERSEKERHEFETERRSAQESLRSQLEESRTRLEQLRNESDGQRARLDAELADRRAAADKQFAAEMEERRSAMLNELAAQESARREDAGRILESAAQQARAQLADAGAESQRVRAEARHEVAVAQRELEELRALQHQVSEQLTAVRALLDWTLPQMPGAGGDHARTQALPAALAGARGEISGPADSRVEADDDEDPIDDRADAMPGQRGVRSTVSGSATSSNGGRPVPAARTARA
jgi:chromosome segregation ATPase